MSYQVLARKYRPTRFDELEGQEHVLRALINALDQDRLHHAYLFTGTRGVGKTTIARILAKCLNCEQGVTSKPCGECSSCVEIAQGRSVDLIEVDAASRTRVEDTRELLDNVQYMPTRSRFKVYLIDEVHMLSNHSFNALLKTLEEPPEHVKFLLATTDPKKLPVTVLSRCLQFNLKNLSPERVVNYLKVILEREGIDFDEPALWQLGRAADGSMRDALSLTDQAISFGENRIGDDDVRAMLGTIDQREVYSMLEALIERDAAKLLARVAASAEFGPDYEMLLAEFLSVLHRIAVAQAVPDGIDNSQGDKELIEALASSLAPEDVQLYYQIGLIGSRDLPLAPDPRDGFEMVMLRMLAFAPADVAPTDDDAPTGGDGGGSQTAAAKSPISDILARINGGETSTPEGAQSSGSSSGPRADGPRLTERGPTERGPTERGPTERGPTERGPTEPRSTVQAEPSRPAVSESVAQSASGVTSPVEGTEDADVAKASGSTDESEAEPVRKTRPEVQRESPRVEAPTAEAAPTRAPSKGRSVSLTPDRWVDVFRQLPLAGVTRTLAANCVLEEVSEGSCVLRLSEHHASLWNQVHENRIGEALTTWLGRSVALKIETGEVNRETPAMAHERQIEEARVRAVEAIESDENVRRLIDHFDGQLNVDSIVPRQHAGE